MNTYSYISIIIQNDIINKIFVTPKRVFTVMQKIYIMMKNFNKSRELTIIAILAGCNAVMELTLGNYLHSIKFPLKGSILVGLNLIIYAVAYKSVPKKGAIATMGLITAMMNLFFGGSFKPWSILAIFLEALIIEFIISFRGLSYTSLTIAGVTSNLFSIVYSIGVMTIILGRGFMGALIELPTRILGSRALAGNSLALLLLMIALLHAANGALFAWLGWKMAAIVENIRGEKGVRTVGQDS